MKAIWYARRLQRMSPSELAVRAADAARQRWWASPAHHPAYGAQLLRAERRPAFSLRRADAPSCDPAVLREARALLDGDWQIFGRTFSLPAAPDWFRDPLTGRRAPAMLPPFRIPHRDEARTGNVKFIWELSRHQHLTLLASAWWLTGDDAFAAAASGHLRRWWLANPFMTGLHWVSGIEVGVRLLAWSWMRALLADWPGAAALFDENPAFLAQLYWHQRYLAAFRSVGSSANNHAIAEAAGLCTAAVQFPWFTGSARWARRGTARLVREAERQTHADGWNREQAAGYHVFVLDLLLASAALAPSPVPRLLAVIARMSAALAASLDAAGNPPRFGDADDGRGVLLDAQSTPAVMCVLDAASALTGTTDSAAPRPRTVFGAAVASRPRPATRLPPAAQAPGRAGSGLTILRAGAGPREIWLRCDAGPHGYGQLAAHGHADALSIELRVGGADLLADPGTYCYHGEPEWRRYFRGTPAHNTLTLGGRDQADAGGPFLWRNRPRTRLLGCGDGPEPWWEAAHDGYRRLRPPAAHRRRVSLWRDGVVQVLDRVEARRPQPALLAYHCGPQVCAVLEGALAQLHWPGGAARLELPGQLAWTLHRGQSDPPLGWYSARFGSRVPAAMLAGRGTVLPGAILETLIEVRV